MWSRPGPERAGRARRWLARGRARVRRHREPLLLALLGAAALLLALHWA